MALILIENGCKHVNWGATPMNFIYEYEDNAGVHQVAFTATQTPKIGDSIDTTTGVLVPLVGYTINNSPGMQKPCEDEGEWPSRIRAQ